MKRTAVFPGSFDPFTKGHQHIVERALGLFDEVVIAVGVNSEKPAQDAEAIVAEIRQLYPSNERVRVLAYSGLTAELLQQEQACCLIRGLRDEVDLAYEEELARVNYSCFGVETLFLLADPQLKSISSSLVRELQRYGKDVSAYLPTRQKGEKQTL